MIATGRSSLFASFKTGIADRYISALLVGILGFAKRHHSARSGVPEYRDPFGDGYPGPFLTLTVEWAGRTTDLLALLDTGADLSQIPAVAAQAMQLEQVDVMDTTTSHNETAERPVYVANLRFEGFSFPATWVIGDEYPIALIGRDVLNEIIARFDGPGRSLDLHRPNAPSAASS